MNQQHTQGPWKAKTTSTRFEIEGGDGFPLLRINGGMIPVKADAQLIEAAPALLHALTELELRTRQFIAGELVTFPCALLPQVRIVLEHAKGGQE